jgi:hypothetical protein
MVAPRYLCDKCGAVLDGDDPALLENHELREENAALYERVEELDRKLELILVSVNRFSENLQVDRVELSFSRRRDPEGFYGCLIPQYNQLESRYKCQTSVT